MRESRVFGIVMLSLVGCHEGPLDSNDGPAPLPEIVAEGSRTRIGVANIEQVCGGTIATLDGELGRVEQELGLTIADEPGVEVDVFLLEADALAQRCGVGVYSCLGEGEGEGEPTPVYVRTELFETRVVHELVHERIGHTDAAGSAPLFDEGLAAAHARPLCPLLASESLPQPSALLEASDASELPKHGEYVGGELLRWLLDTRGPEDVLGFMAALGPTRDADDIRAGYEQRFGAALDAELFAHLRALDEPLSPARAGCMAPAAPPATTMLGYHLSAALDCDSPLVHNDFVQPERVYVEWTVEFDESTTLKLRSDLPDGTELHIEPCACQRGDGTATPSQPTFVLHDHEFLVDMAVDAGLYRLRFYGRPGATVDVDLSRPCDLVAQDCPDGLACTITQSCIETPTNPQLLGEPCNNEGETFMGSCDIGLICLGDRFGDGIDEGVCMAYCGDGSLGVECPAGLACEFPQVCTTSCDPSIQACDPGFGCYPDLETGDGACLPAGALDLLEPCSQLLPACGPGLMCATLDIDGCGGDQWLSFEGCCTPSCDPNAADPGCPAQAPICDAADGNALGMCSA